MLKNHFTRPRFKKLFNVLMINVHFLGIGPPTPVWGKDDYNADDATLISKKMRKLRYLFPASYQSAYVDKAIRNFENVHTDEPPGILQALAGAVTNHDPKSSVRRDIRRLVAVISNIHRSFLDEGKNVNLNHKKPSLPPLAAFIHDPLESKKITAFTVVPTQPALKGALRTTVPVVGLPSSYRKDLLLWGVLAHETCGHPVLHTIPNLLEDLTNRIGTAKLPDGPVIPRHGSIPRDILLAIWKHWIEEAASDVFAVLNIGPSYGIGWGLFMAGLNASFALGGSGKIQPELSVKSLADADQHPVDILTLYVVMGALDTLDGLSRTRRSRYIREIESIAALCGKEELELITVRADRLKLSRKTRSSLEKKLTKRVPMFVRSTAHTTKSFKESIVGKRLKDLRILDAQTPDSLPFDMLVLPQNEMKNTARRVGAYIATAKLPAFGGKSVQDLETWDNPDEESAWRIAHRLIANQSVAGMGDDAQLLAGGVLAFYQQPEQYKKINEHLMKALDVSFECDPIWSPPAAPEFLDARRLSRRSRHK
jgi:hypothetical protein